MLSLVPATLSVVVAYLAFQVSARQATLAREKLRFDLFDARFAAWEDINEGISSQVNYVTGLHDANTVSGEFPGLLRVHKAKRKIKLLFGPEMHARVEELERLSRECLSQKVMMNAVRLHDPIKGAEHFTAFMIAQKELSAKHDMLLASLDGFMDFCNYRALSQTFTLKKWLQPLRWRLKTLPRG